MLVSSPPQRPQASENLLAPVASPWSRSPLCHGSSHSKSRRVHWLGCRRRRLGAVGSPIAAPMAGARLLRLAQREVIRAWCLQRRLRNGSADVRRTGDAAASPARALRDATAMHAAGRWANAAQILAPLLRELRDIGAHLPHHWLASGWQRCALLYEAALRAYVADIPRAQANQQLLSDVLCRADDDAFMRLFSAMTPAEQRLAAYMSADSDPASQLVHLAIAHDCALAWEALHARLQQPDAMFEPWVHPLQEQVGNLAAMGRRALEDQLPKLARTMVMRGELTANAYLRGFSRYAHDDHPVVRAAVLTFVNAQLITPTQCLQSYPDRRLLQHLLEAQQVTIAEVAALRQPRLRAALFDIFGATKEGGKQLCEAQVLTKQEVFHPGWRGPSHPERGRAPLRCGLRGCK